MEFLVLVFAKEAAGYVGKLKMRCFHGNSQLAENAVNKVLRGEVLIAVRSH